MVDEELSGLKCCKRCGNYFRCTTKKECCPECEYFDPEDSVCLYVPITPTTIQSRKMKKTRTNREETDTTEFLFTEDFEEEEEEDFEDFEEDEDSDYDDW